MSERVRNSPGISGDRQGKTRLNANWRFHRGDIRNAERTDFDDSGWRVVDVPHDWAIEGPFTREADFQGGYLPFAGVGWYRTSIPGRTADMTDPGRIYLEFDGVMRDAHVWVNGTPAGHWFYGYSSFVLDITEHLDSRSGPDETLVAVRVENEDRSSRWYPGSGIYRDVWLTRTASTHIAPWGIQVVSSVLSDGSAEITVTADVRNYGSPPAAGAPEHRFLIETTIVDAGGSQIAAAASPVVLQAGQQISHREHLAIGNPVLWDIDAPHLHGVLTRILDGDRVLDECTTPFGIRTCRFDPDNGFFLNDRHVKLKGVNLHHDLGPLGAAVNRRATERQLEIMREMGANAIRCAHNPPSPVLLDLCDEMGFLVIDEVLDEWKQNKKENGYPSHFDEWAERDTSAMVIRDRNHPSIVLWSIGNEIRELDTEGGKANARRLAELCRSLDPTRPVTSGIHLTIEIDRELMDILDVPGLNYWQDRYVSLHAGFPDKCLIATESSACLSTRGEYHFPVREVYKEYRHESKQITSYDVVNTGFGALPDVEFAEQEQEWIAGEFVWSGFDYHGEPDPYEDDWPAHSSYFGIVDMCGFRKDRFYLYRSVWTREPVLHLLPHWTWPGREGEVTPVTCYTNADSAELFVNGVSAGRRFRRENPYRFTWDDVVYHPGSIAVTGFDSDGTEIGRTEVKTAGNPHHLEVVSDRKTIRADGVDLAYLTVSVMDRDGNLCPHADNEITFDISGAGSVEAVGNGNPISLESYQAGHRRAFHGLCLLVVRSAAEVGRIDISAHCPGLEPGRAAVTTD